MSKAGKNIKKIRNIKGLSQQAFADLFQLTRGNISSYEELRAEPKIEVLVKIANYFSIPLDDFIQRELSVNELLHYNTRLVVETEKLKMTQQLKEIPYVPMLYVDDYIAQYGNNEFMNKLPRIVVPLNSKSALIAIELDSPGSLPAGVNYKSGDVLIYEQVTKENIHHATGKLGMMLTPEGIHTGIYEEKEGAMLLSLNNFISYPFEIDKEGVVCWVLKASYGMY